MIGTAIGRRFLQPEIQHIEFEMTTPKGENQVQQTTFILPVGDFFNVIDENEKWLATIKILRITGNEKDSQE